MVPPLAAALLLLPPLLLATAAPAVAHPPANLVMDRAGNVYYSDLARVWRIAANGDKQVVVPGVHTHELWLDASGALWGEHLWYEGEQSDRWGHTVWRRDRSGQLHQVHPPRPGFRSDWSFVRDGAGDGYTAHGVDGWAAIERRSPRGEELTLATVDGEVRWLAVAADGTLFYTVQSGGRHHLYRLASRARSAEGQAGGRPERLAHDLVGGASPSRLYGERHATFGLTPDGSGGAYVTVPARRHVLQIAADGRRTVAARSPFPWAPTAVLRAPDEALWLLEEAVPGRIRVRRIAVDGSQRTF